jgi:predicted alpha/beta-fold hydrolase
VLEAVLADPLVHYGAWFGGATLAAWLGRRQGRNPLTCFVAAVVATPLLALPVLLWLGPLQEGE